MKGLKFIFVGLLLLALKFNVNIGIEYPVYVYSQEIGGIFQSYMVDNTIGSFLKFDIFNDVIGCLLLMIGLIKMSQYSKKFKVILPLIAISFLCEIILPLLPFWAQSETLCYITIWIGALNLFVSLFGQYYIVKIIDQMTRSMQSAASNNVMFIGILLVMVCQVITILTTFVGLHVLSIVYTVIMSGSSLLCIIFMNKARQYYLLFHKEG